ncbi:MAG: DNA-protecting protein DprA [Alphaproteobacteria bacterium]|nr:DNA-protecting protein DprA [Alphaproteobacteria bacterium]
MSPPPTTSIPLADKERIARLRLIRTENIGPVTFRELLDRFGSAERVLDALPELARRGGRRRPLRTPSLAEAEREIAINQAHDATLIVFGDPNYPPRLAAIDDAPVALSVRGQPAIMARPNLALVGARNASVNGRRLARQWAAELGTGGYVVTSGLARGIDGAAHEGALDTGTVAVLAGGVDVVYPAEHHTLYDRIVETGAVLAEAPIGTTPQARHFPSRNRIIAGLSLGVLVVEAAKRSGSLITAHRALDQGREVFAAPGSPLDPRSAGTNGLLQEGAAHLVQTADDVLWVLDALPDHAAATRSQMVPNGGNSTEFRHTIEAGSASERTRRRVLDALGPEPVPVDELIRECQLSAPVVAIVLLEAELAGLIDRYPGNQVSRRADLPA